MAGGLLQPGAAFRRHGMAAFLPRNFQNFRIDPALAQEAVQHRIAALFQQGPRAFRAAPGMRRIRPGPQGSEQEDFFAEYAAHIFLHSGVGLAQAYPETQGEQVIIIRIRRFPHGEAGRAGSVGQGFRHLTGIARD